MSPNLLDCDFDLDLDADESERLIAVIAGGETIAERAARINPIGPPTLDEDMERPIAILVDSSPTVAVEQVRRALESQGVEALRIPEPVEVYRARRNPAVASILAMAAGMGADFAGLPPMRQRERDAQDIREEEAQARHGAAIKAAADEKQRRRAEKRARRKA